MLALALAALLLEPLADRHRLWLTDEVRFLISGEELARFEALSTSEERDAFIDTFWRRRDPTPGTLRNEALRAHEARLAACDRLFGSPDRGRLSERGRVYQLLGPPVFRERFTSSRERIVPIELWHYTGLTFSFLPDTFYLVFFRPDGQSPHRLWSPTGDGIEALLRDPSPGRFQLDEASQELARVDPELASAVGEGLVSGPPSASVSLLAALEGFADLVERERAPRTSTRAAADFTRLAATLEVAVLLDDADVTELHYALALAPGQSERLSWRLQDGRLRSRIALVGRLLQEDRELERWEDELDLEADGSSLDALARLRFSFQGRRLLPPGASRLELSLASPGGAFAVEERVLPDAGVAVVPAAAALEGAASRLPFRLGPVLLMPGVVPLGTDAFSLYQMRGEGALVVREVLSGEERLWSESGDRAEAGPLIERSLPTSGLPPGTYRLRVRHGDRLVETSFRVGVVAAGDERIIAREPTAGEEARYRQARAGSFLRAGDRDRAIEEMELAVAASSGELHFELELATLRFADGRCEAVLRQLRPLAPLAEDERDPDVFVLLAACGESLGDFRRAQEDYARALALSPDDARIRAALERLRRRNN